MSFDEDYRDGHGPYDDVRKSLTYVGDDASLKCVKCQTPTKWLHTGLHISICSKECYLELTARDNGSVTVVRELFEKRRYVQVQSVVGRQIAPFRGLFHDWTKYKPFTSSPWTVVALVEDPDGIIHYVLHDQLQFLDSRFTWASQDYPEEAD